MKLTEQTIKKLILEELQKISEGDVIDMQDYRSNSKAELFAKVEDKVYDIGIELHEIINKLAELSFEIDELYAQGAITRQQTQLASLTISKIQVEYKAKVADMIEKLSSIQGTIT